MSYREEFPDFDYRLKIPRTYHDDWEDVSWNNNVCPSIRVDIKNGDYSIEIFQNYKNKNRREDSECKRYCLLIESNEGVMNSILWYSTDDWEIIEGIVKGTTIC